MCLAGYNSSGVWFDATINMLQGVKLIHHSQQVISLIAIHII